MKLISLLPLNLREAEKEEKPEAGGDNPFAAAADEEGGDKESGGEEGGGEEGGGEEADKEGGEEKGEEGDADSKSTDTAEPMQVVFDPTRVRRYNDVKFKDNKGTVTNVSKFGLAVKLPAEQTISVNFEDIL